MGCDLGANLRRPAAGNRFPFDVKQYWYPSQVNFILISFYNVVFRLSPNVREKINTHTMINKKEVFSWETVSQTDAPISSILPCICNRNCGSMRVRRRVPTLVYAEGYVQHIRSVVQCPHHRAPPDCGVDASGTYKTWRPSSAASSFTPPPQQQLDYLKHGLQQGKCFEFHKKGGSRCGKRHGA